MQFLSLLRQAPRPLAFGALHSFGSSFGQTFLVALFVPFIGASLAINETEFANIYAGITIASALCLPFIGRLIDRIDMLRYSLATMVLLTIGCLLLCRRTVGLDSDCGPVYSASGWAGIDEPCQHDRHCALF